MYTIIKHSRSQLRRKNYAKEDTWGAGNVSDHLPVKNYYDIYYSAIVHLSGICPGGIVERTE